MKEDERKKSKWKISFKKTKKIHSIEKEKKRQNEFKRKEKMQPKGEQKTDREIAVERIMRFESTPKTNKSDVNNCSKHLNLKNRAQLG